MDSPQGTLPALMLPSPSITVSSTNDQSPSMPSKKRKGTSYQHVVAPAEKRIKRMGRPKNGWTATRKRKLIRLYLMTELDVVEISQVLRAESFQPCKRDIQKQLTILLQNRPNQVRSRGSITKTRLRLLREVKDLRTLEKAEKSTKQDSTSRETTPKEGSKTPTSLEDLQNSFPLTGDPTIDWSWLDFESENPPLSPTSSPPNLSLGSGSSTSSPTSPASQITAVKLEPVSESPEGTPRVDIMSPPFNNSYASPMELKVPKAESLQESKFDMMHSHRSRDNASILTTSTGSLRSVVSLSSLKKRLHSKYSGSFLHDIKSLMDRLTISESSDTASVYTKGAYHSRRTIPSALEPVIVLPGFFPQYCWEHLNTNELKRCDDLLEPCSQGPIYSPMGLETHRAMRSDVMFRIRSSSVRKDDLGCVDAFGNTVLHVAATLGARPSYLSLLLNMGADPHALNVASESFLHLVYIHDTPNIAEFRFLIGSLVQRRFNFEQQDDNGQTVFHGLVQSSMPNEIVDDALRCFQYHGVPFTTSRDNLGLDVSRRAQKPYFNMLPPPAEDDESIYRTFSMTTNNMSIMEEYSSPSYVQISRDPMSTPIENLDDLRNYEFHADLLRTILRASDNPSFEDSNGRNGLHCLAAVRLDLPVSTTDSDEDGGTPKPARIDMSVRERYLEQLIVSGVDPNSYDREGNTPFMAFVMTSREEEDDNLTSKILGRLCRAGANINRRNRQGETPLHVAVKLGRRAATKFLIARGANVHARTSDGTGILSLGLKHSDRASKDDVLYAQISLCMSLVASAGAVSAPTILREWASEEFRIAPDRPISAYSPRPKRSDTASSKSSSGNRGYYGKEAYGSWTTMQGKSWMIGGA